MFRPLAIIFCSHSQGLINDAQILSSYLNAPFTTITLTSKRKFEAVFILIWASLYRLLFAKVFFIYMESLRGNIRLLATQNLLFPNQEWLRPATLKVLDEHFVVCCKSHYAQQKLALLSPSCHYLGFVSIDRLNPQTDKNFGKFLHLAGKSQQKGTLRLLELWAANPHWPDLSVVVRHELHHYQPFYRIANIRIIDSFLSEQQLTQLINESGIHVCPSETEGFGHNLVEALSVGSVVVTTDAPPMNELIPAASNFLVPYDEIKTTPYCEYFQFSKAALAETIETILSTDRQELTRFGQCNRSCFIKMQSTFKDRLNAQMNVFLRGK